MKSFIFFNNRGDAGKTTLVYHFAFMLAELGYKCLAVDLDPQANLSSMLLTDEELERIYGQDTHRETIISSVISLDKEPGDRATATVQHITDNIGLLAGDLDLSLFEDKLSSYWSKCVEGNEAAFRFVSSFSGLIENEAARFGADYCIIDVGPNFGALNRATFISADYVIVPMAADFFSLQGLRNLGKRLTTWKDEWKVRVAVNKAADISLPKGEIVPLGYVVMQHGINESRPVQSNLRRANRIPSVFNEFVLNRANNAEIKVENDTNCLAILKHYHSLIPMALEVRKPIFHLKPADGAIGAHFQAVLQAHVDFKTLTEKILERTSE